MTYKGRVKDGVIVLEPGTRLPEGAEVRVEPVDQAGEMGSLREGLLRFAGTIKGMPPDSARNHDHYLYGKDNG